MLGFGKKTEACFFCPAPAGKWKLDINTAEGVITKHICDECKEYLTRISNGESIYELAVERFTKDEDSDE
jgi:hypothetical protein